MMTDSKRTTRFGGVAALLVTSLIWGFAFSAQRLGARYLSSNVFMAMRSWVGTMALFPVIFLLDRLTGKRVSLWGALQKKEEKTNLLKSGSLCGLVLCVASILQQHGLHYSSAGKGGFLTALYIVIVPVLGLFFKRKANLLLWFAVAIVLCGSWLLCGCGNGFCPEKGDIFLICCGFCYAIHIMVMDHYAPGTDCVRLSFLQFLTAAVLSTVFSLLTGDVWDLSLIRKALGAILFCGIGSTGIAYTLQAVGQKYVHPVAASLLMSLESVFSAVGGWLILGEVLNAREITGCLLILTAVILAQIPLPKAREKV